MKKCVKLVITKNLLHVVYTVSYTVK